MWEQFQIMFNPSNNDEVSGVACYLVCKVCILYKKKVSGRKDLWVRICLLLALVSIISTITQNQLVVPKM